MLTESLFKRTKKLSLNAFCAGAIAGLVAITPASGYVTPYYSLIFGVVAGSLCFLQLK
jgi:Amt family ammonium transporter